MSTYSFAGGQTTPALNDDKTYQGSISFNNRKHSKNNTGSRHETQDPFDGKVKVESSTKSVKKSNRNKESAAAHPGTFDESNEQLDFTLHSEPVMLYHDFIRDGNLSRPAFRKLIQEIVNKLRKSEVSISDHTLDQWFDQAD